MLRQNIFGRNLVKAFAPRPAFSLHGDLLRMSTASKKSWVPIQEELLQRVTTNSLIHEMTVQATESAAIVVPWFLNSMPVSEACLIESTDVH